MIELKVEGMTCGGCVASVKRAFEALDAHSTVMVDLPTGRVEIESSVLDREHAVQAIEQAGFDVVG